MSIPDYQSCMLPFLRALADNKAHALNDVEQILAEHFKLPPTERSELLPSGQQGIFRNRIGWARTYLKKAGLVDSPKRGIFKISARGFAILKSNPERIDSKFLEQFEEFREFRDGVKTNGQASSQDATTVLSTTTPEESIELAHQGLRSQLSQELLTKVLAGTPTFFEQLVVELLVKMGYGGSRREAGKRIGQTGDGGIDGIIKEDQLGLDAIYLQAKRWQGSVGRPEIQKFVGALQGQRAKKGVFITTSSYTAEAIDYAAKIETKVVLIDGQQLTTLMIDFDVGVSAASTYVIKRIDSDYFEEA